MKKFVAAILVSFITGFLVLILGFLDFGGNVTKWQSLGKPPEQVIKIVGTTMMSVTVETISKNLYICENWSKADCWTQTTEVPSDDIVDVKQSCFMDPGGVTFSTYALKEDGIIYLKNGRNGLSGEHAWVVWLYFPLGAVTGFIRHMDIFLF